MRFNSVVIFVCAILLSQISFSQENSIRGSWEFSLHIGTENFDSDTAYQEYIEDSAWNIGGSADFRNGRWLTSFGMALISYSDEASFQQQTINGFGNRQTSDSDASAVQMSFALGPHWLLGKNQDVTVFTQAGLGVIFASTRSIPSCSDCYEEDIDINSGGFAKIGVLKNTPKAGAFGINFVNYFSGDQKTSINLMWSTSY